MEYLLKNEFYTVTVSDVGAEMISIKNKDGRELVWQPTESAGWKYRTPWLFPVCSKLCNDEYEYGGKKYPMPMHGFIRFVKMDVVSASDTALVMRSESYDTNTYPFLYAFTVAYELNADKIRIDIKIDNLDKKEMPFMFGWHPGFVLPSEKALPIKSYAVKFERTENIRALPKGKRPEGIPCTLEDGVYEFDATELDATKIFKGQGTTATLFTEGCPHTLKMNWSESFPYFCIWRADKAGADYVCLEPWSDMVIDATIPEAFETKLMSRLAPKESAEYFCEISFT